MHVFGESHIDEVAGEFGLDVLARIPMDPALASLCDNGTLETMENQYMDSAFAAIESRLGGTHEK